MKIIITRLSSAWMMIFAVLLTFNGCKEDEYSENYDINWPIPQITEFSPTTSAIETELTIKGNNLDKANRVTIGTVNAEILSKSATEIVIRVPRLAANDVIRVSTLYKREAVSVEKFVPEFPTTTIAAWPVQITPGKSFKIKGENVDLITSVIVGTTEVAVDGSKGGTDEVSVSTADANLMAGTTVVIKINSTKGGIEGESESPAIPVTDEPTPRVEPIVLFDFEDGLNPFVAAGSLSPTASIDGGGLPKIRGEHYLHVEASAVTSWSDIGSIEIAEAVNLSDFREPYFSFLVNTNGAAGYFQLEDGNGNWYHFKQTPDDYMFVANGWEWRSYNLEQIDDGQAFDLANIKAKLVFKTGNVSGDFEINIDQVMFTDGRIDPNPLMLWDFEGANPYTVIDGAATSGFNLSGLNPVEGTKYFTVKKNNVGGWQDLGSFVYSEDIDLNGYEDPYLNFWVDTNNSGGGYFQLEDGQGSWAHFTGTSSPGDDYKFTNDGWKIRSIRLSTFSWEGTGFNPSLFRPTFTVKTGNVGNSEPENFELNIDAVTISEGRMY